jgi:hypothetical protein
VPVWDGRRDGSRYRATISPMDGYQARSERSSRKKAGRPLLPSRRLEHQERFADGKPSVWPLGEVDTESRHGEASGLVSSIDNQDESSVSTGTEQLHIV